MIKFFLSKWAFLVSASLNLFVSVLLFIDNYGESRFILASVCLLSVLGCVCYLVAVLRWAWCEWYERRELEKKLEKQVDEIFKRWAAHIWKDG